MSHRRAHTTPEAALQNSPSCCADTALWPGPSSSLPGPGHNAVSAQHEGEFCKAASGVVCARRCDIRRHQLGGTRQQLLDQDPKLEAGQGIHACPGAPLARLELRILIEELLARTTELVPADVTPARAHYPGSGFAELPLVLR